MFIKGLRLEPTNHALVTILAKGFTPEQVLEAFDRPKKICAVSKHPDQWRIVGNGVALVGKPDYEEGCFVLITVYADAVLTPPRADQLDTPEGQRYAERYAQGLGRG